MPQLQQVPLDSPAGPTATREPPVFACTWSSHGVGSAWIVVSGELDIATVPQLSRALGEAQRASRLVVLDLHELVFMDSCGVHAIVEAGLAARRDGRRLLLVRAPPSVEAVFALTDSADDVELLDLAAAQAS